MTNVNANKLSVWYYDTAEVRTMMIEDEPWWVLTDVCKVLGHSNSRMVTQRLEEDDVTEAYTIDALGRKQAVTLVNESGLYEAIFRSNIPSAKEFRRWVTHEVLPALRKNGYYGTPNNSSNNERFENLLKVVSIISKTPLNRLPYVHEIFTREGFELPDVKDYISDRSKSELVYEDDDISSENLIAYINEIKNKYKLSMAKMSKVIGVPHTTLVHYYNGDYNSANKRRHIWECLKRYDLRHRDD